MPKTNEIHRRRAPRLRAAALVALTAGTLGAPRVAHAEDVTPTGKGIAGCALLGGELVVFGEALFGVRSSAAYLIGAGAGLVAGGVGGYFLEQSVSDGRIPAYTLAGGLALIIPAVVVALDQTRYLPTEGARDDAPPPGPPSDPGRPGGSSVVGAETPAATPATPPPPPAAAPPANPPANVPGAGGGGTQPPRAPQSLLDVESDRVRVGLPVPQIRPVFSVAERKTYGIQNAGTELRFPVFKMTF